MKMTLINQIEALRIKSGLRKADMARKFNVPEPNYNNWVYRQSLPKEYYLLAQQLIAERSNINGDNSTLTKTEFSVPLISWVSAGQFVESPDLFHPGDAEEWMPRPPKSGSRTFALRVEGDSMTSPFPGQRSYPHGTIIYVDPDREVTNNARVIGCTSGEYSFKTYVEDAGRRYLKPINPTYDKIDITDNVNILGVVIGSYFPE